MGGFTPEVKQVINREYGGIPVVDADTDLRLALMPEDIDGAAEKDFENCVLARACIRQFGVNKVLIMHTVAYVALPDSDGNLRVERFIVPTRARELIEQFDKGKKPSAGTAFVLRAPKEHESLEHIRSEQKRIRNRKAREKRRAAMKGNITGGNGKTNGKNRIAKPKVLDYQVRRGTGLIQMRRAKDGKKSQAAA